MIKDTILFKKLRAVSLLINERLIWFNSFDSELKNKILDWIKNDQLQKGIDEDGDIMGLYSEWTEKINPEKIAGTPYTLFDTGAFYRSLFIVVLTDSFIIDGNGEKTDEFGNVTDLFKWLGEGIIGLTEESKEKLKAEITKKFTEYVRKILSEN